MRKKTAAALLFFVLLSILLAYPLPLHMASAVEDRQDALLNVWITAWDGHQLLTDPVHLFDANIFYPYRRSLAYSELLLGNALLSLPITAASGNPVLGYNVALVLSFALTGLGTYLLVKALTRSPAAGIVGGIIFAFCSYRMTNLAQAQLLTTQWMPLALLALLQLLRHPRLRHAIAFALFFSLQALSSFYYGILLALAVLAFVVLWLGWQLVVWITGRAALRGMDRVGRRSPSATAPVVARLWHLLLAAAVCTLLTLPFGLPYFQVQNELGFSRTLADSEPFSASLRQYLMVPPSSTVHGRWLPSDDTPSAGGYPVDALFPGIAALTLALWGIVRGQGRGRWSFLLLLLLAWVLSLGPRLYLEPGRPSPSDAALPYAWLYAVVPGFKALRAPVRFDALVTLALSALAGYGMAALGTIRASGRARLAGLAGIVLAIILESWVWPAAHVEPVPAGDGLPPVTRWLADQPAGPVLELPMAFTPGGPQLEYQYLSTYHWQPTPDGYSGFIPQKHGQIVYEMESFPSERSLRLLQALGAGQAVAVVVHGNRYQPDRWRIMEDELATVDELVFVRAFGADRVYKVQPRSFDPARLTVQAYFPDRAVAGNPYTAYLLVRNNSPTSFAVRPTDLIRPTVTWRSEAGSQEVSGTADIPLVTSPEGGTSVIPLSLIAPATRGTYRLAISEGEGPLGTYRLQGSVQVGDVEEESFPVPAQLSAWSLPPVAEAGHALAVRLTWTALGKLDAYYSVYVKLLDSEGNVIAGWDGQPRNGEKPTLTWVPAESFDDVVSLSVPPDSPMGAYRVEAGMYRAEDLARCLLLQGEGYPVGSVELGTVRIE